MYSILLIKKFLGLVEMNFGLVNAYHSLPKWQAVADKTEQVLTSAWGEESSLVRERTSDCVNGDGTTRFERFCISMLSRVLPVHRRQGTTGHDNIVGVICFYCLGKSDFAISCFKHALINETQSKYDCRNLSSTCHNFCDHS